jgi:hypothetical protein
MMVTEMKGTAHSKGRQLYVKGGAAEQLVNLQLQNERKRVGGARDQVAKRRLAHAGAVYAGNTRHGDSRGESARALANEGMQGR